MLKFLGHVSIACKDAVAILIMFDLTSRCTLNNAISWYRGARKWNKEERLMNLRQRLEVPFDGTRLDHQDALKQLWRLAYPHRELPPLKSELWKDMGWQGADPSTDFRSGRFISLENLIFFAENYPESFHRLLHKLDGKRSEWEYPFAAAGVNLSFVLTQMLGLKSGPLMSRAGARFLELLGAVGL